MSTSQPADERYDVQVQFRDQAELRPLRQAVEAHTQALGQLTGAARAMGTIRPQTAASGSQGLLGGGISGDATLGAAMALTTQVLSRGRGRIPPFRGRPDESIAWGRAPSPRISGSTPSPGQPGEGLPVGPRPPRGLGVLIGARDIQRRQLEEARRRQGEEAIQSHERRAFVRGADAAAARELPSQIQRLRSTFMTQQQARARQQMSPANLRRRHDIRLAEQRQRRGRREDDPAFANIPEPQVGAVGVISRRQNEEMRRRQQTEERLRQGRQEALGEGVPDASQGPGSARTPQQRMMRELTDMLDTDPDAVRRIFESVHQRQQGFPVPGITTISAAELQRRAARQESQFFRDITQDFDTSSLQVEVEETLKGLDFQMDLYEKGGP